MQAFSAIGAAIRQAVGLILPVFAKAGDFRRWNPWVWRILHLILLAAILVGLWWLNGYFQLGHFLQGVDQRYRQFFLPALFLLLYILSWLGWWLWKLLGEEEAAAEFPDVDAAWAEAVAKLDAAGIGVADAPLFLVLGRPAAGLDALFTAGDVKSDVRAPTTANAPLRVYANRDVIYVTCEGASGWGRLAAVLAGEIETSAPTGALAPAVDKTVQFGDQLGLPQELIDEMRQLLTARETRELTPPESDRLRVLAEMTKAPAATTAKRAAALSSDEAARGTARLSFLCRLIRRDRSPWCPINGMLIVVPWAAMESEETAKSAGGLLQRDLAATRKSLQLRFPTFAVVSDLESARGFAEFRRGFPAETLKARIGQRVPLAPDMSNTDAASLYERAIQWIGQSVLPAGIVRFLRHDSPQGPQHNRNLYLLLREVANRSPRLARMLSRAVAVGPDAASDEAPLFGGCYLAGTGRSGDQQAFVSGVLQRLVQSQSSVAWTPEALEDDARYRRWTSFGYMAIVAFAILGGALVWWWTKNQKGA
jgi:type VI protein secretion system component VasK